MPHRSDLTPPRPPLLPPKARAATKSRFHPASIRVFRWRASSIRVLCWRAASIRVDPSPPLECRLIDPSHSESSDGVPHRSESPRWRATHRPAVLPGNRTSRARGVTRGFDPHSRQLRRAVALRGQGLRPTPVRQCGGPPGTLGRGDCWRFKRAQPPRSASTRPPSSYRRRP